ncbi:MAG: hypothetical protein HY059_09825 [Proteobacteria bacterium]|nr:hypothetical protein [Pseudomonadota bacterium]
MACVLLGKYLKVDLRTLARLLESDPRFGNAIGSERIPDFSTVSRHSNRFPEEDLSQLLSEAVAIVRGDGSSER